MHTIPRRVSRCGIRRPGFSLIELLVVIGIMGTLVAIVLPAVTRGFARARETQCASQLQQIALGAIAYARDNRGRMPPRGAATWPGMTNANPTFADFVGPYLQIAAANKPTVWRCPVDKRAGALSSFGLNIQAYKTAMTDLQAQTGWPILMIQNPSTVIMLADSGGKPGAAWDVWFDPGQPVREQQVEFRHGRPRDDASVAASTPAAFVQSRANFVFYDGHVEAFLVNSLSSTNWLGQP